MKWFALCFTVLYAMVTFSPGQVAAQTIDGLHGDAAATIEAEIRRNDFGAPVMAHVFYGDLTGIGTEDAIAFLYHPSGGNSDVLTTWIWRDTENGYELARAPSIVEVFGLDPRNVRFSPGRIEVTTTVMKPGDPRCCPSGEQTFNLLVDRATATAGEKTSTFRSRKRAARSTARLQCWGKDLDVPITEEGGDGQMANCSSSTVYGLEAGEDGFLAVRSGPGTQYRKIDELTTAMSSPFSRRAASGLAWSIGLRSWIALQRSPVRCHTKTKVGSTPSG